MGRISFLCSLVLLIAAMPLRAQNSYANARTDLGVATESLPFLCAPAPTCTMNSTDLNATGVTIHRVTDANTNPVDPTDVFTTDGSAEQMEWNSNSTAFFVDNVNHGVAHFFTLNTGTGVATKVSCTFSGTNCWNNLLTTINGNADGPFSGVSPYVYWSVTSTGTAIQKMDFTATVANPASADTDTTLATFSACSGIPTSTGANELAMNNNDTRFATALGPSQDNWTVVYVYDTVQGCRYLNLAAFTIGGQWGTTGTASYFSETGGSIANAPCSQIHNVRMSRDGRWADISTQCNAGGVSNGDIMFWDIATGNIYRDHYTGGGSGPYFGGGHNMIGFNNYWANVDTNYSSPFNWFTIRTLPPTGTPTWLSTGRSAFDDSHLTWNNQTSGNLYPYCAAIYQNSPPSAAWGDEIVCFQTNGGGNAFRLTHMYTLAHDFNSQGMANISRDGKWIIWTSDWNASRDDVFLIATQVVSSGPTGPPPIPLLAGNILPQGNVRIP
jgi:hypothetical protein